MAKESIKARTISLLSKAVERLLADERRAVAVAQAVGRVQKGKEALGRTQENLLKSLGVATRSDYKDVSKRLGMLKRRLRHLADRLERS